MPRPTESDHLIERYIAGQGWPVVEELRPGVWRAVKPPFYALGSTPEQAIHNLRTPYVDLEPR